MDSIADDQRAPMHPAIHARRALVTAARSASGSATNVNSMLVAITGSLRLTIETTGVIPDVAQIATAVEGALPAVSSLLSRWFGGEVMTVTEIEALTTTVQAMRSALILARKLCAGDNVVPLADRATDIPLHNTGAYQG